MGSRLTLGPSNILSQHLFIHKIDVDLLTYLTVSDAITSPSGWSAREAEGMLVWSEQSLCSLGVVEWICVQIKSQKKIQKNKIIGTLLVARRPGPEER